MDNRKESFWNTYHGGLMFRVKRIHVPSFCGLAMRRLHSNEWPTELNRIGEGHDSPQAASGSSEPEDSK